MANVQSLPEKWLPVSIAPADTNLEVGVMDKRGDVVALEFPVRKKGIIGSMPDRKNPSTSGRRIWRAGLTGFTTMRRIIQANIDRFKDLLKTETDATTCQEETSSLNMLEKPP
jgi:hypothetical protein